MKFGFLLLSGLLIQACSSSTFRQGNGQAPNSKTSDFEREKLEDHFGDQVNPPVAPPSGGTTTPPKPVSMNPDEILMPPGTAVIPVAIGGASLTCFPKDSVHVACKTQLPESESFKPKSAYYANELEKRWVASYFSEENDGTVVVKVPESYKTVGFQYGVLLVDSEHRSVGDYAIGEARNFTNLLADPSFENKGFDPADFVNTRVIKPSEQTNWKASSVNDSKTCEGFMELSSMSTSGGSRPFAGNQWLELMARCKMTTPSDGKPISISQSLNLIKGHQYYVSFVYRRSSFSEGANQLYVTFGGNTQLRLHVSSTEWVRTSFIYDLNTDQTSLTFAETGIQTNGATAIDDIYLVDITASNSSL